MKVIPGASQRTIALETGRSGPGFDDLLPNDLEKVRSNSDLQLFEGSVPDLLLHFHEHETRRHMMTRKVRDAVNYAIDRQLIIDTIASGSGEPWLTPSLHRPYSDNFQPWRL